MDGCHSFTCVATYGSDMPSEMENNFTLTVFVFACGVSVRMAKINLSDALQQQYINRLKVDKIN